MDTILCTYCANLEVLDRNRHGTKSRCPLCKSEMLRTDSGATYRIPSDAEQVAHPIRRWRVPFPAALAVAAVVLAATGLWVVSAPRRTPTTAPAVTTNPPRIESAAVERAAFKSGRAETFVGLVKPTAHPPESAGKPFVSPPPKTESKPELLPLPRRVTRADFWTTPEQTAESLLEQVARFPEVSLGGNDEPYDSVHVFKLATDLENSDLKTGAPLVDRVAKRNDLSGLPFTFGKSQLDPKAAKSLAIHSTEITRLLDGRFELGRRSRSGPTLPAPAEHHRSETEKVEIFWSHYAYRGRFGDESIAQGSPALEQVLMAKSPAFRESLVHVMRDAGGPSTKILVRRALFDLDPAVRRAAVAALETRNQDDYTNLLIEGFRYPWPPVARHAAEALVALERTDLAASLQSMRNERDPYVTAANGATTVREAVRVNHFKNCLLCHPPIKSGPAQNLLARALQGDATVPVGVVPIPGKEIPKTYTEEMGARIFVRADVTHLRQDFSVRLDVTTMDPWPTSQRFDILVRSRVLRTDEEATRQAAGATLESSPNGAALLFAIERLQPPPETSSSCRSRE